MEATVSTKAIVLTRAPINEHDVRVVFFTADLGKVELLARGAKKLSSKLAPHLEPLNLTDLMIINGKQINYVGSAISRDCFCQIKNDWQKAFCAGQVIGWVNKLIKPDDPDQRLFLLLHDYLTILNKLVSKDFIYQGLTDLFYLRLLANLGYSVDNVREIACAEIIKQNCQAVDWPKALGKIKITPQIAVKLAKISKDYLLYHSE